MCCLVLIQIRNGPFWRSPETEWLQSSLTIRMYADREKGNLRSTNSVDRGMLTGDTDRRDSLGRDIKIPLRHSANLHPDALSNQ